MATRTAEPMVFGNGIETGIVISIDGIGPLIAIPEIVKGTVIAVQIYTSLGDVLICVVDDEGARYCRVR